MLRHMNIPPRPEGLSLIDGFSSYAQRFMSDEIPISAIKCRSEQCDGADFYKIDARMSIFENCTFHNCCFEDATFIDVVFQSCDLSNSKFTGAYFERCHFTQCKCIGVNMRDSVINHTAFQQSNFQYAHFDKTRIADVLFDHIDFTEASLVEAKLMRFETTGSRFIKNNFYKTMLAGMDFTTGEFVAPTVSSPPVELKGVILDSFQAADLMRLWGVVVKR
jgi:uncharacterized protein YjbI with pentapeptide repeats